VAPTCRFAPFLRVNRDELVDFLVEEAGRRRAPDAREDSDVEQLGDAAFEPDPLDDIAGRQMRC
jgi:hypothetical protein